MFKRIDPFFKSLFNLTLNEYKTIERVDWYGEFNNEDRIKELKKCAKDPIKFFLYDNTVFDYCTDDYCIKYYDILKNNNIKHIMWTSDKDVIKDKCENDTVSLSDAHRDNDEPAFVQYNNNKHNNILAECWVVNGKIHREHAPAIITYIDNNIFEEYYFLNSELKRSDENFDENLPSYIKYFHPKRDLPRLYNAGEIIFSPQYYLYNTQIEYYSDQPIWVVNHEYKGDKKKQEIYNKMYKTYHRFDEKDTESPLNFNNKDLFLENILSLNKCTRLKYNISNALSDYEMNSRWAKYKINPITGEQDEDEE